MTSILILSLVFYASALTVSDVSVMFHDSLSPLGNKLWVGEASYTLDAPAWVWLEFSNDSGRTYDQRLIQGAGNVGWVASAGAKSARWLIDNDQGPLCRIRVRANSAPLTYSMRDADSNKFPFPLPDETYANVERLTGVKDAFSFTNNRLPPADFYVKVSSGGRFKAGFAKKPVLQDWNSPTGDVYFSAGYFESADGSDRFLVINSACEWIYADTLAKLKDSIQIWYDIPREHIYWSWDHTHVVGWGAPQHFRPMLDSAMARKEPVSVGYLNYAMPAGHVHFHSAYVDPAREMFTRLYTYGTPDSAYWLTEGGDTLGGWPVNSTAGGAVQHLYDGPNDSYLQLVFFRNDSGAYKGVFMKTTAAHDFETTTPYMDSIARYLGGTVGIENGYPKVWGGPVVFRMVGFGGNASGCFRGNTPFEVSRFTSMVRRIFQDSLPVIPFSPLSSIGVAEAFELYGISTTDKAVTGNLPGRTGIEFVTMRFNDVYLTSSPAESPVQQGMYLRGRTLGKKLVYNGFANALTHYYQWGRMNDAQCFECGHPMTREEIFNMAQDMVRSVNILEPSETR